MTRGAPSLPLALLLVALGGCSAGESPRVSFAGCAQVFRGPSCAPAAGGELTLFVAAGGGDPGFSCDELPVTGDCRAVPGGRQCRVRLIPGARRLVARFANGTRPWTLTLAPPRHVPRAQALETALRSSRRAQAEDDLAAARARCTDAFECAVLEGLGARAASRRGDATEARARFAAAVSRGLEAGCISCAARDGMALAHSLIFSGHDLAEAKRVLETLAPQVVDDPSSRMRLAYYGGALAKESGDLRAAMRLLTDAAESAEHLGSRDYTRVARTQRALVLQSLGRNDEALHDLETLVRELGDDVEPCERAVVYHDLAWAALLALDQGIVERGDLLDTATANLDRAIALHAGACDRPIDRASAELDRAFAALLAGDLADAQRWLDSSQRGPTRDAPWLALWRLDLDGRLALARSLPHAALASFAALERLASAAGRLEGAWRARLGQARSFAAMGATSRALAAYSEADALSFQLLARIGLQDGRADFVNAQERALEDHLELLVRAEQGEAAIDLVRRAHRRALVSMSRRHRLEGLGPAARARWDASVARYRKAQERADALEASRWKVPRDELVALDGEASELRRAMNRELDAGMLELHAASDEAPLSEVGAGELMLVYFFGPARSYGFARSPEATRAVRLPRPRAAAARGEDLLEPFADLLALAPRVRVTVAGRAAGLAVHALRWRGEPLIAHSPVVYSADLGVMSEPPSPGVRGLVVFDPRGDLAQAREEGRGIMHSWTAKPWLAMRELSGIEATRQAVVTELGQVDLFHYAGHGRFGGPGGWESGLALAGRSSLEVGQVLSLPAVPRVVVMAACDGGKQPDRQVTQSLSIANAFLTAGSRVVVATDRPVSDDLTRRVSLGFHDRLSGLDDWQIAEALRRVQLEILASDPAADWMAFRVLVH